MQKKSKIAHIDIDPVEISKNVYADIPVVGDVGRALNYLNEIVGKHPECKEWMDLNMKRKKDHPLKYEPSDIVLKPQYVLEILNRLAAKDAIVVTDVGQHQMWAAQFFCQKLPRYICNLWWVWYNGIWYTSSDWCTICLSR